LAKKISQEKDRGTRREILDEARGTSEYETAREIRADSRQTIFAEKNRQKELVRDRERTDYVKEVEVLKFKFESKIADTNRVVDQFFAGFGGNVDEV